MTAELQKQIEMVETVIREHHLAGSLDFHQMAVQIIAVLTAGETVLSPDPKKPEISTFNFV